MRFSKLGHESLENIFDLCQRSLIDPPEKEDLQRALFDTSAGATVTGDPEQGVVVTVVRNDKGYVRLLAVDPVHRGKGVGRALIEDAERDLADLASITVGADAPDYIWPGVDVRETAAICLFEAMGYTCSEVHYNMFVDLSRIPRFEGGAERPKSTERDSILEWFSLHWPNWLDEGMSGFDREDFLVARDEEGIAGIAAWNVNRQGWFGPTAVRPALVGKGYGRPLLLGALEEIRRGGLGNAEIAWIGPHKFYARTVGATIHRTFWALEKKREPGIGSGQE